MKKAKQKKNTIVKTEMSSTLKTGIVIMICILLLMGILYLVTTKILDKDTKHKTAIESYIQYDKILAGESFEQPEEEYLVVYYDSSDKYSSLSSLISSYQSAEKGTRLYSVDLADGMNKKYMSDVVNTNSPSELRVMYPTMLRFKNHSVIEVITSNTEISEYLSK